MSMSPEADDLIAALDFTPTCITHNHNGMTVRPQAFWAVYPKPCCGDQPWLFCDDCLRVVTLPNGITRFPEADHQHQPARDAVDHFKALG